MDYLDESSHKPNKAFTKYGLSADRHGGRYQLVY